MDYNVMLARTKEKLESLHEGQRQRGVDGNMYSIKSKTKISPRQGEAISVLHRQMRPDFSIEIGLAYGFSALYILDSMAEAGYGKHIAVDPYQLKDFHGIAIQAIKEAQLDNRFEWVEDLSAHALAHLHHGARRAQFVYIDGSHLFDSCLIDFVLSDQLLDIEGVIVLDDMWMPSIRKVVSFIRSNFANYEEIKTDCDNIYCVRKKTHDRRAWDHFKNFGLMPSPTKRLHKKIYNFITRT